MARKKLLTEGEIRQFMKLANLRPVGKQRLSEMYPGARDEEETELAGELGAEDAIADEEGDELGAMDDEMAMDDIDAEPEGGGMVSMDDFMSALEQAIEDVTGEEADVSEDPGEEEEVEMEMGPDDEMDMEIGMGPEGEEEVEMDMVAEIVRKVKGRLRERHGHRGARSDDPGAYKKQSFGAPSEEEDEEGSEVLPDDESDDSPRRRSRASSGHRPDQMEENMVDAIAERLADELRKGRDKKSAMSDKSGKVGAPDEEEEEEDSMAHGAGAGKGEKALRYDPKKARRGSQSQARGFGRMSEDEVVSEVAKRVATRLQGNKRREAVVDTLAERIMKRLTK